MKKEQETITVKEAAKSLSVSEMTVYRMLKAGKLNAVKSLVNRHWQSFISIDEKWKKEISKKQYKTKDLESKAESAIRNAWDCWMKAREQSNVAKNASADANRYYLATKAFAEDTVKYRAQAAESALETHEDAQSAAYCVIWCVCGTVLSLLFAIAHFIL